MYRQDGFCSCLPGAEGWGVAVIPQQDMREHVLRTGVRSLGAAQQGPCWGLGS